MRFGGWRPSRSPRKRRWPVGSARDSRQRAIYEWALETFGDVAASHRERALRFLEEALELVQAAGLEFDDIHQLACHVYDKSSGDLRIEMGAASLTLVCLAESLGLSADACEINEFARVRGVDRESFRARQNAKAKLGIAGACGEGRIHAD